MVEVVVKDMTIETTVKGTEVREQVATIHPLMKVTVIIVNVEELDLDPESPNLKKGNPKDLMQ
jgi:hypothetical protein